MELTFESAFSTGGMIGNASYILLIASMAMRDMFWLRLLAIFSGLAGIAYDVIWLTDPVGAFWESMFTIINLVQWLWLVLEKRRFILTATESSIRDQFFPHLPDLETKQLLTLSSSQLLKTGDQITRQGEPVEALCLITKGNINIVIDDTVVSSCQTGDYIGEISYITSSMATATTVVTSPTELLCFKKESIESAKQKSEKIGWLLYSVISTNLIKKLKFQEQYV